MAISMSGKMHCKIDSYRTILTFQAVDFLLTLTLPFSGRESVISKEVANQQNSFLWRWKSRWWCDTSPGRNEWMFFSQGYSITVRVRLVSHFDAAWYLFHFHIEFNTARRKKWGKDRKTICSSEAHIQVRAFRCLVCNSLTHLLRFCCW